MRKLLSVFLLFAACRCASSSVSNVYREAVSRSVLILDKSTPTSDGYCSGVALDANTVLTAGHCYAEKLTVNGIPATVVKRSETPDLMVLRVATTAKIAVAIVSPKDSDEVICIANRSPILNIFNHGYVSKVGEQLLYLDLMSMPGYSGAGIFGTDGRLVGVLVGIKTVATGWGELPTFCVAVSGDEVKRFLESV